MKEEVEALGLERDEDFMDPARAESDIRHKAMFYPLCVSNACVPLWKKLTGKTFSPCLAFTCFRFRAMNGRRKCPGFMPDFYP